MSTTLTGIWRFKEHRRLFGPSLMVLEVEEKTRGCRMPGADPDGSYDPGGCFEHRGFRPATAEEAVRLAAQLDRPIPKPEAKDLSGAAR